MEQVQRRFVTFNLESLSIHSITWGPNEGTGCVSLPVSDNNLVAPFFNLTRRLHEYYPLIDGEVVVGFRRRGMYESQIVLETEESILRGLRSFENFITQSRILFLVKDNHIALTYDANFFDALTNKENIDRLKLSDEKLYNLYITRNGDPFTIYETRTIKLSPFAEGETVTVPYEGPKDISIYVVAKN